MFRSKWFIWCLALAVLCGATSCTYKYKCPEDGQLKAKSKSEMVAAEHGFTVVEDVPLTECKASDLELVPFLQSEDGGRIGGETLRKRAVTLKSNLGLMDAKRLLDNQSEIPIEFRGKVLVFTGTFLRDSDGSLHVSCLYGNGDRWCLSFYWIDNDFGDNSRLLRCKS
ncbi:MAG: hypothetical protein AAB849_00350 [Patescibacteria group bacterium]